MNVFKLSIIKRLYSKALNDYNNITDKIKIFKDIRILVTVGPQYNEPSLQSNSHNTTV